MLDYSSIIREWSRVPQETLEEIDDFMTASDRRYAIGQNSQTLALSKTVQINGIVNDFATPGDTWQQIPVLKGEELPTDAIVVNCSSAISPISVDRRLTALGVKSVIPYADCCRTYPDRFPYPAFVQQTRADLEQHNAKWRVASSALADSTSRRVLADLLKFRLTGDYRYMTGYAVRLEEQYFEDFLPLIEGEVFVDAGGFDGDTTERFCSRCPGYRKVLLFEPSARNLQEARIQLAGFRNIDYFEMGLSNAPGFLSFDPNAGPASSVQNCGEYRIRMTSLDTQIRQRVSFIKMDLEGWELKALIGAGKHIQQDYPKLAIAVYHTPSDFWRILDYVKKIRSDYRIYLRHYTEGWSETVMYFVPNGI